MGFGVSRQGLEDEPALRLSENNRPLPEPIAPFHLLLTSNPKMRYDSDITCIPTVFKIDTSTRPSEQFRSRMGAAIVTERH